MVKITFEHSHDVFNGTKFRGWIYKLFPSARFDGFKWGNWYPTINVPFEEFRENYKNIPEYAAKKIAAIRTDFGNDKTKILSCLVYDVRPINKITNLHPDFEKHTGRERYGKYVEEVIEIPVK